MKKLVSLNISIPYSPLSRLRSSYFLGPRCYSTDESPKMKSSLLTLSKGRPRLQRVVFWLKLLIWEILLRIILLIVLYISFFELNSLDFFFTFLNKMIISLGTRSISIMLIKYGIPGAGVVALAIFYSLTALTEERPLNVLPEASNSSQARVNQPPGWNDAGPSNAGPSYSAPPSSPWRDFPSIPHDLSPIPSDPSVPSLPSIEREQSVDQADPMHNENDVDQADPMHNENDVDQPLMDERERREQLAAKLAARLGFHENRTQVDHFRLQHEVETQLGVEISLERHLRMEGYTPATRNRSRNHIRELVLYTRRGNPVKESILEGYLSEMEDNFSESKPYSLLLKARDNHELNLFKPGDPFFSLYE